MFCWQVREGVTHDGPFASDDGVWYLKSNLQKLKPLSSCCKNYMAILFKFTKGLD